MEQGLIRVLLVDENLGDAEEIRLMLTRSDQHAFSIEHVTTLSGASRALRAHRFEVALVDLHVPGSQGVESLQELVALAPETPMIVTTEEHSEAEAIEAMRAGAQEYLVKARLNASAIQRIVLYCIERQRALRRTNVQYAVSRVLADSETLEQAETGLLRVLGEHCGCSLGQFWQFDHWSSELVHGRTWVSQIDRRNPWRGDFKRLRFARGEGLPGIAWACGSPEFVTDLAGHSDLPQCEAAALAGYETVLAFPVRLGQETLGVMEFFSSERFEPEEELRQLLMNAGDQLGQFMARKLAEQEKEHLTSERLLILDCASEGIYGVDLDGCVTFMNRAAAALLQCAPSDVLRKNSHELFCQLPSEKAAHSIENCPIVRTIATGDKTQMQRDYFRRGNSTRFEAEYSVFPLVEAGEMKGAVICFSDVTDRKRMEVEVRHSQKLEAVGALAAGIAHEINTPIQFVGDNARFLQDAFREVASLIGKYEALRVEVKNGNIFPGSLQEVETAIAKADWEYLENEIPKALEQALDGVERVATIVRGMKEFSHVDRSPEKAAADLNKALESTLIVARNELKYVADVEVKYGELPPLMCHLGDLNQVFLNLLINAAHAIGDVVKGTGTKGRIEVRTRQDGEWVEVAISDTGTGIPDAVRDKIFDPFFTTKEVGKGTGQGLALARAIVVEKHGGTLTFDTEMGKGTTFFMRLPLAETNEAVTR